MVELHISTLSTSWFYHLSYLNLTTKHGALMEFQLDSDPLRQDNASMKGYSAFELHSERQRPLGMELVHVCLDDVAFRGHVCEMRLWHLVSNFDTPPSNVAADLTHLVAVRVPGSRRVFWAGMPPRKNTAQKRG